MTLGLKHRVIICPVYAPLHSGCRLCGSIALAHLLFSLMVRRQCKKFESGPIAALYIQDDLRPELAINMVQTLKFRCVGKMEISD